MNLFGHVRNGVIVLDSPVNLEEGTPVRVEALVPRSGEDENGRRAERYRQLLQRLEDWNKQDAADDERLGNLLQEELATDHGFHLRDDVDLEKILAQP